MGQPMQQHIIQATTPPRKPARRALDPALQHGYDWDGQDVAGWDLSEKMDGIRAYWDGATLRTRGDNVISIPSEWRDSLPGSIPLDCELYHGIDGRFRCGGAARSGLFLPGMELVCFEAPSLMGNWRARMDQVDALTRHINFIRTPPRWIAESTRHAQRLMHKIKFRGGEGLIARMPGLTATPGRTPSILKMKR